MNTEACAPHALLLLALLLSSCARSHRVDGLGGDECVIPPQGDAATLLVLSLDYPDVHLWEIDADGAERLLHTLPYHEAGASRRSFGRGQVSPDGRFVLLRTGAYTDGADIHLLDLDSGEQTFLGEGFRAGLVDPSREHAPFGMFREDSAAVLVSDSLRTASHATTRIDRAEYDLTTGQWTVLGQGCERDLYAYDETCRVSRARYADSGAGCDRRLSTEVLSSDRMTSVVFEPPEIVRPVFLPGRGGFLYVDQTGESPECRFSPRPGGRSQRVAANCNGVHEVSTDGRVALGSPREGDGLLVIDVDGRSSEAINDCHFFMSRLSPQGDRILCATGRDAAQFFLISTEHPNDRHAAIELRHGADGFDRIGNLGEFSHDGRYFLHPDRLTREERHAEELAAGESLPWDVWWFPVFSTEDGRVVRTVPGYSRFGDTVAVTFRYPSPPPVRYW